MYQKRNILVAPSKPKLMHPIVISFLSKFKLCQALYRSPFRRPQSRICVLQPCAWPLFCLQLYTHEHDVTLNSSFSVIFLPFHCRNASILKPTGGSQLTSIARNDRNLCYGRQKDRAAVQPVDILGMCKWSQLLAEGVEQCQGSAAGGVLQHEKHAHENTVTTTPAEFWLEALKQNQGPLVVWFFSFLTKFEWRSVFYSSLLNPAKVKQTLITAYPFCPPHAPKKTLSSQKSVTQIPWKRQDTGCLLCRHSPARALMRERSNSLAVLLSLSSSSSERSKRVLMWLYCCVISTLSKSVVEVIAVASAASGRRNGDRRPQVLSVRREMSVGDEIE